MRGNRYNTVDSNFDGAVPPNTGGNPSLAEQAKQKMEEQKKKSDELRENEKARAVEFAKKRALVNVNSPKNEAPESKTPNKEKPDEDNIQAEEKPEGKKLVWNPNSRYAGMGRIIQHVKPLKKVSDTILNMGNRYAEDDFMVEDNYAGFMSMVSKAGTKISSSATKVGSTLAKTGSTIAKSTSNVFKKTPLMSKSNLVPKPSLASTAIGPVMKPTIKQAFGIGTPLMGQKKFIPKLPGVGDSSPLPGTKNPLLGNNIKDKVTTTGPLNKTEQLAKNNTDSIKNVGLPATNTTGKVTSAADRAANKAKTGKLTPTSNVMSTAKGILNSKLKSAAVGAVVAGSAAAANGKNPVGAAMGGALAGGTISHLASKSYSFLDNMPSIIDSERELLRAKLIANGYSKELSLIDKTEARERKEDKAYLNAKKIVKDFLSGQRTNRVNLKGNRGMLLKKLSNPKEDKLYSSLSLLYFHCENSQI